MPAPPDHHGPDHEGPAPHAAPGAPATPPASDLAAALEADGRRRRQRLHAAATAVPGLAEALRAAEAETEADARASGPHPSAGHPRPWGGPVAAGLLLAAALAVAATAGFLLFPTAPPPAAPLASTENGARTEGNAAVNDRAAAAGDADAATVTAALPALEADPAEVLLTAAADGLAAPLHREWDALQDELLALWRSSPRPRNPWADPPLPDAAGPARDAAT